MRRSWTALACALAVAATCSSCGTGGAGGSGGRPVMGTTDQVSSLDPAGAYDQGSWIVYGNTYQTLLSFGPGSDQPTADAASSCGFTNSARTAYGCTMRTGLRFSNGDSLAAADVAFSFNRIKKINSPEGPAPLLSNVASVAAAGRRVTFRLSTPDATFPMKLATGAASIVDHRVYPADHLLTGDRLVGSGVYEIKDFHQGKVVDLVPNPKYRGSAKVANDGATIRYYTTAAELAAALKKKQVDFVPRDLPPAVENAYENGVGSYQTVEDSSAQTHLMVFDSTHPPFDNPAVREAVARLVDREALARDVYSRTVTPLYSLIPQGILGHTTPFFDQYGSSPDLAEATAALRDAGIHTPVKFTLTVSSGAAALPEGDELRKELDRGGLFQVTVKHLPWTPFVKGWASNEFDAFTVGWSADYPDADDFVAPLLGADGVFHDGYHSALIDSLLNKSRTIASRPATGDLFSGIQSREASDIPILPLWQSKDYAVSAADVHGSSLSLTASGITCLWLISVGGAS